MEQFQRIKQTLHYIEDHLGENLDYEQIAGLFNFSPYYFHRLFSAIVGKPIAAYIRERRLAKACNLLAETDSSITSICFQCGFNSSQSFSRAFKNNYCISPTEYRNLGYAPVILSVEEIVMKFQNKLKGGILVHPKLIDKEELLIAGVTGDGSKTHQVWKRFMELEEKFGLANKLSDNGYEIRLYNGQGCKCHVGFAVSDSEIDDAFTLFKIPAAKYASFDVYVASGYDSENDAMEDWLEKNKERFVQRQIDGSKYVVEYYDEKFSGDSEDSIVEIWIPLQKLE